MLSLLTTVRRQIKVCLIWIIVFSLHPLLATTTDDVVVHKVLVNDNQHILACGNNLGMSVNWFYRQEKDDSPVNIIGLQDTTYIMSSTNLFITNIKPAHEGFYNCDQVSTLYHLIVLGTPKFVDCPDAVVCHAEEDPNFNEGDNIRFNLSVGFIQGGSSGETQKIRRVGLSKDSLLANCLTSDLSTCVVNPSLTDDVKDRFRFRRNESDPWFDIEINITNAVVDDSGVYSIVLEAEDVSVQGFVTQSTSVVTVSVKPTSSTLTPPSTIPMLVSSSPSVPSSLSSDSNSLPVYTSEIAGTLPSFTTTTLSTHTSSTHTKDPHNSSALPVSTVVENGLADPSPSGEIEEVFLVVIVLGSSFLILIALGCAVLIVLVFKRRDREKVDHGRKDELNVCMYSDDQATMTTYMTDDRFPDFINYKGKNCVSCDNLSNPRCSHIFIDDHHNSHSVQV